MKFLWQVLVLPTCFLEGKTINEGPEREQAHQIVNFLTGPVMWMAHPTSMLASEYPLVKGRQAVAIGPGSRV